MKILSSGLLSNLTLVINLHHHLLIAFMPSFPSTEGEVIFQLKFGFLVLSLGFDHYLTLLSLAPL